MAIKNVELSGSEEKVSGICGGFCNIINRSGEMMYASAQPAIVPEADGVMPIEPGTSVIIEIEHSEVYLLGTGKASLVGHTRPVNFFGPSADKTADGVTNILDNPDFRINQRGASGTISSPGYFVDRWKLVNGSVTVNADKSITLDGTIQQILEFPAGEHVYAHSSAGIAQYDNDSKTFTLTAAGEKILWTALCTSESITEFVPPDRTLELIKCQRFFRTISRGARAYCVNSESVVFRQTFEYPMRDTPKPSVLNPKPILTYSNGWIDEPDCVSIAAINLTAYGVCYIQIKGFNLKSGENAFASDYPFVLATDNAFGLSADL